MRLLHTKSRTFEVFEGDSVPLYAILSHTWGRDEVSYQDIISLNKDPERAAKHGFRKIDLTCNQAHSDGFEWVWIDTCNIDKSSSAELSEAINSMFQWYKRSAMCYVYFEDIASEHLPAAANSSWAKWNVLRSARWFSRGWTLQELLASEQIIFFSALPEGSNWSFIGSKSSEAEYLASITGIERAVLENPDLLPTVSIARRMSWAATRETTRPEDIAYCLLGIFQVNMPLLYGEGMQAFIRLQEEILKNSEDESLFAWTAEPGTEPESCSSYQANDGILATHPRVFGYSSNIVPYASKLEPYIMTNRGLRIEARLVPYIDSTSSYQQSISCILHCRYKSDFKSSISIALELDQANGRYRRSRYKNLRSISHEVSNGVCPETIYIHKSGLCPQQKIHYCLLQDESVHERFNLEAAVAMEISLEPMSNSLIREGHPEYVPGKVQVHWDKRERVLLAALPERGYFSALLFSRLHSSERRSASNDGFVAFLCLPNKTKDVKAQIPPGVFMTPLMRTPHRASIHLALETGFSKIDSCEYTLDLGDAIVRAQLTAQNHFGVNTYVLDLDIGASQLRSQESLMPQAVIQALPQIKISDPHDGDITAFEPEVPSFPNALES